MRSAGQVAWIGKYAQCTLALVFGQRRTLPLSYLSRLRLDLLRMRWVRPARIVGVGGDRILYRSGDIVFHGGNGSLDLAHPACNLFSCLALETTFVRLGVGRPGLLQPYTTHAQPG